MSFELRLNPVTRCLLSLLSAGLAIFAFPPFGIWQLVLVAWIPLFFAIRGLSARAAFYVGLLQGFGLYAVTLSWMWLLFGPTAIALWLILSLFVALACSLMAGLNLRKVSGVLLGASAWVGCEFFRSEIYALHFPWMTPGVGMKPSYLDSIVGVYGVSFLIILSALLIVGKGRMKLIGVGVVIAVFGATFIQRGIPKNAVINVLAMQNEHAHHIEKLKFTKEEMAKSEEQFDVVLWPEISVEGLVLERESVRERVDAFSNEHEGIFIFGSYVTANETEKYNTALTMQKGEVLGMHFKNRPVPLFNDGKKGTEAKAIDTPIGRIGTPICFDCDHESVIRRMVADGAELILVPSLDAISWTERQHLQHAELFRHRAAENHRWIAVAATSGMTQIIDPTGNRVQNIPLMDPGFMKGAVGLVTGRTFYNQYGWLIGWICMGVTVLVLVRALVLGVINKFKS